MEEISSYINREDAFFYALVYDPVQKTLLADRGSIRYAFRDGFFSYPVLGKIRFTWKIIS